MTHARQPPLLYCLHQPLFREMAGKGEVEKSSDLFSLTKENETFKRLSSYTIYLCRIFFLVHPFHHASLSCGLSARCDKSTVVCGHTEIGETRGEPPDLEQLDEQDRVLYHRLGTLLEVRVM